MKKIIKLTSILAIVAVLAACVYAEGQQYNGQIDIITESVIIGEGGQFPLAGMLNLPRDASAANPVPAAIIVQGSGPSDMDGNMFGVRPYYDIARFLAENGIASIRHDKRTLTHVAQFDPTWTAYHEAIADALLAAEMLRSDPRVDSDRIYIIGHSLGGTLAPRIHTAGGNFAGLILLAATPRPLLDLAVEQLFAELTIAMEIFLASPEAQVPEILEIATMQAAMQTQALLELAEFSAMLPYFAAEDVRAIPDPILGAFAYYWWDLAINPMEHDLARIDVPMLVLQGARDFQVLASTDFAILRGLLGGRDNVEFILYNDLNHHFMLSNATNFVDHAIEITTSAGSRVAPVMLWDIVNWINTR